MERSLSKVLLTKIGLDGHDRGVRMIAYELRNRGAEVILLGIVTTPEDIAEAALEEDVSVIGVSILSGSHAVLLPRLVEEMRARGLEDVPIICGGTIPNEDVETLLADGVAGICPTGTSVARAADVLLDWATRTAVGVVEER